MEDPTVGIINIVPLYQEIGAAPAAANLTYRGGPLLATVDVYTVFWGDGWSNNPDRDRLNAFFDYIVTSSYMDQLAEYSVQGYQIGYGTRSGSSLIPTGSLTSSVSDADIQSMLQTQIASGTLPAPNAGTLYFVFLPDGVTVTLDGQSSCQQFCGYHNANAGTYYAVVPFPSCSGCVSSLATFDAITEVASHELAEAVTDPVPGQGWYDDTSGEIGDICAWQTKSLGAYTVQLEWSNQQQSCV